MKSPTQIEAPLVIRAQAGDQEACRHIIEALHRPVLGFAYRMLGPTYRSEMEDIAQEIFLKVFRALGRFDTERGVKFTTWVLTFVRNHCLDILKKRRLNAVSLTSAVDRDGQIPIVDEKAQDPRHQAQAREIGERIDEALKSINPEQRAVFQMREREGMDYADIVRRTGTAEGTVKSRLHRARLALRILLADLDPDQTEAFA